jgi:hypothetical protein
MYYKRYIISDKIDNLITRNGIKIYRGKEEYNKCESNALHLSVFSF